jgi:hypothetical protein
MSLSLSLSLTVNISIISTHSRWIGISDGFTNGVFRGIDGSAITWANWSPGDNEPKGDIGFDCVFVAASGEMFANDCMDTQAFICQGKPGKTSFIPGGSGKFLYFRDISPRISGLSIWNGSYANIAVAMVMQP